MCEEARPINDDTGLADIHALAEGDKRKERDAVSRTKVDILDDYVEYMMSCVDALRLSPLKLVVNAGNGCAGIARYGLESHVPCGLIKVHSRPESTFLNGIPSLMLPENKAVISEAVLEHGGQHQYRMGQ